LLLPPHDSGPVWLATPSPYGSFIHDTLPVFPALSGHPTLMRRLLDPQVAPTAAFQLGGRAVYTTHNSVGCLPRVGVSLRIRIGELIRLDSHQLDYSLAGCSDASALMRFCTVSCLPAPKLRRLGCGEKLQVRT
jgi:hypothetical protein